MQLLISSFIVVLLMGCNGGGASAPNPNQQSSPAESIGSSQQAASREPVEFEDVQGGRGKTEDGIPFSYHLYKSSDGVGVTTTVEDCGSTFRANRALQRKSKRAVKIIERRPKLDDKGKRVGERVVAMFAPDSSEKENAAVLWTEGSQFHYIESSSLRHALRFEEKFYR